VLFRSDETLEILAHELRHLWQACIVDFKEIYNTAFSGEDSFIFMRITEADATAFASQIISKINNTPLKKDMSEAFIDFQKTATARKYDMQTLSYLRNIEKAILENKFQDNGLRAIFNVAKAPPATDKNLMQITLDGISEDSKNYMGYKNMEELKKSIITNIPNEYLDESARLIKRIRISTKSALKL